MAKSQYKVGLKKLYLNWVPVHEYRLIQWKTYCVKNNITTMGLITKLVEDFLDKVSE